MSKKITTIRMPRAIYKALKDDAKKHNRTVTAHLLEIVSLHLGIVK